MKTSRLVMIIVSCSCIVAGIVLLGVSFFMNGGNSWMFSTEKYIANEYTYEEDFDSIEITDAELRVELLPSTDGKCKVVLNERERMTHNVSISGKKLSILLNDQRKFWDYINFGINTTPTLTLYLPENEYSSFSFKSGVSRITLPDSFSFGNVNLEISTGKIAIYSDISGTLTIDGSTVNTVIENTSIGSLNSKVSTGETKLTSVKIAQSAHFKASTGDTCLSSVEIGNDISFNVSTADFELNNVSCHNLSVEVTTGDLSLLSTIASGEIKIKTDTGDVEFDRCDAATLNIETDTGDVEGTLLSDKIFYATSDTGKVKVPRSESGGICQVKCDTGDIIFTIVK